MSSENETSDSAYKSDGDDREELAEDRTDFAERRTALANERTYGSWLRSGLAAMGAGVVVAKLAAKLQPEWMAVVLGVTLCLSGAAIITIGVINFHRIDREATNVHGRISRWAIRGVAVLLVTMGLMLAVLLVIGDVQL